jgi:hypothetical protein
MILITTSILLNLVQSMTKQGPSYPLVLFSLQFGPLLFPIFLNLGYPILSVQSTLWFYWDFINYDVLYLINCMIFTWF